MSWASQRTIFSGLAVLCLTVGALIYGLADGGPGDPPETRTLVGPGGEEAAAEPGLDSVVPQEPEFTDKSARRPEPQDVTAEATSASRTEDGSEERTGTSDVMLPTEFLPLTEGAMAHRRMVELTPEDSSYDARLEAQQTFQPMEQTLMDLDSLSPETWREALEIHRLRNAGIPRRAEFLRKSGHPDAAEDLLLEWSRVYGTWQARAYGRSGPPGRTQ